MDKLIAGKPINIGKVTLLPIERYAIHSGKGSAGYWLTAHIVPHAIVIRDSRGIRAINLETKELSLDVLNEAVPGLREILIFLEIRYF